MKLLLLLLSIISLSLGCEKVHEPLEPDDQQEEEHDQGEIES